MWNNIVHWTQNIKQNSENKFPSKVRVPTISSRNNNNNNNNSSSSSSSCSSSTSSSTSGSSSSSSSSSNADLIKHPSNVLY